MIRVTASALALLASAALLGGCGDDGPKNSPNSGTKPSCGLAPESLVGSALGDTVKETEPEDNGSVVVCRYEGTAAGIVTVRFQTDTDSAVFKIGRDGFGQSTADYPGFQDEAFTSTLAAGGVTTNTLVARKGTIEISITSKAAIDKERALADQLFAKL